MYVNMSWCNLLALNLLRAQEILKEYLHPGNVAPYGGHCFQNMYGSIEIFSTRLVRLGNIKKCLDYDTRYNNVLWYR